jgi:hypothetical protein
MNVWGDADTILTMQGVGECEEAGKGLAHVLFLAQPYGHSQSSVLQSLNVMNVAGFSVQQPVL